MIGSSASTDGAQAYQIYFHEGRKETFTERAGKEADITFVGHRDTGANAPYNNWGDFFNIQKVADVIAS